MAGTMRLTTRFTEAHDLVSALVSTVPSHDETGLGGTLDSRIGRIASLALGDVVVHEPIVSLARERTGGDASPPYDGLIGIGLLRRFHVYVDIGAKHVIIAPASRSSQPFVYAPAGARFESLPRSGNGALVVRAVADGTPAARAGLRAGDTLLAVGDRETRGWTRRDWQDAVDRTDGRPLRVLVSRGGRRLALSVEVPRLLASPRVGRR
jgi:membrane-associated protease RseP (regulator of RpoE activity)